MSFDDFGHVHVGFPNMDETFLVSRHQSVLVLRPAHYSNRSVVCLDDSLELESQTVSLDDFTTSRTCYKSAASWHPEYRIY